MPPIDKQETKIRRMFAGIAPWYDTLNHLLSLNIDRWWRQQTTRLVPPPHQGTILDLCTGTGDLAFAYWQATKKQLPIVGADFCHEMLVRAKQKAKRLRADQTHFLEADAQRLPFSDSQFALVTVAFGLRNVTDYRKGLAEMVRVTEPGGRVAVLEFSKPRHWLLGPLYRAYFTHVLPRMGQLLSRSRDQAYNYLPASVLAFPDYEDLANDLRAAGLTTVNYIPLTFGIATLYVGTKPI
jgi:demethylmenaquinone methyltransferase/2-methoxy-6-polyprenyl-1,4-benzoquinol methylase